MTSLTSLLDLWPAFAASLGVCVATVMTQRWHGRLSLDHDLDGVQKLHHKPVPRVGGVGVLAGLLAAAGTTWFADSPHAATLLTLLLCALPVFAAGLIEDLTKRVGVRTRLIASFSSGLLAAWLLDAHLTRLDTPGLDLLVATVPLSFAFTAFAVGGVTNAVNIIDGLNGLASGSVALMLGGLGAIAWTQGDGLVLHLCLVGMAAVLGFMVLNFPFGKIFLGDGGAYLAGFWLAECAVLLLVRNPEVSTWAPLLVCFYPVWETGFSMWRRRFVRRTQSGRPDRVHLHHLMYRRLATQHLGRTRPAFMRHALSIQPLWAATLICQGLAVGFVQDGPLLAGSALGFALVYMWAYAGLVRGCTPRPRRAPLIDELPAVLPRPVEGDGPLGG